MRTEQFEAWLKSATDLKASGIRSRISNCRTVDNYEGDLDEHFASDGMVELAARLTYSTEDQRRGLPQRHAIPIDGDIRNGTATLKSATTLYWRFCEAWPQGASQPATTTDVGQARASRSIKTNCSSGTWPTWSQPSEDEALILARMVMAYVRFLNPDIVAAIVEDNERHREEWRSALSQREIRPDAYLWNRSPCAFPGVRRYAGSREVAIYRGHLTGSAAKFEQALRLDDNDCPKHVWSFVLCGKQFQKHGPLGYALAHLADHKSHANRFASDFDLVGSPDFNDLYGLYSCPTNAAYIPTSMVKPTDFGQPMRNLLLRRAEALYGKHCNLTPDWLRVPPGVLSVWDLDAFNWAEPVGSMDGVPLFLEYRNEMLERLISKSR